MSSRPYGLQQLTIGPGPTLHFSGSRQSAAGITDDQLIDIIKPIEQIRWGRRFADCHGLPLQRAGELLRNQPTSLIVAVRTADADDKCLVGFHVRSIFTFKKCVEQLIHGS